MYKRILVLAPHTDDGELGCGGTIAHYAKLGVEIHYAAFSLCEDSLPEGYPKDTLLIEMKNALRILGLHEENIHVYNYKVRHFSENRQSILDNILCLSREISPDLVLMPSLNDLHQDHQTIAIEGIRAFKKTSILSYELPWNSLSFSNQAFIVIDEDDLNRKIEALECYESQKERKYTQRDYTISMLKVNGVKIGKDFAEVFEVPRLVLDENGHM